MLAADFDDISLGDGALVFDTFRHLDFKNIGIGGLADDFRIETGAVLQGESICGARKGEGQAAKRC